MYRAHAFLILGSFLIVGLGCSKHRNSEMRVENASSDSFTSRVVTNLEQGAPLQASDIVDVKISDHAMMRFCWIPPGEAVLGSPASEPGRSPDEREHDFETPGFWLGKFEVTQAQWAAVMGSNPSYFSKSGHGKDKVKGLDTSTYPVEHVSWKDCQEFLSRINTAAVVPAAMGKGQFALPLEDEWEFACRASAQANAEFHFGTQSTGVQSNCFGKLSAKSVADVQFVGQVREVGAYEKIAPHPWGLCDMHGNVSEWCADVLDDSWSARVHKGGSWTDEPENCRSAARRSGDSEARLPLIGFRVCYRPEPRSTNSTQQDEQKKESPAEKAEQVVRAYLACEKWEDRLQFIMNPTENKPLLEARYKKTMYVTKYSKLTVLPDNRSDIRTVQVVVGKLRNQFGVEEDEFVNYVVRRSRKGWRIDWQCTAIYNPMTLGEFKADRPTSVTRFRVAAKLTDFYWGDFLNAQNTHYAFELVTIGNSSKITDRIYGYAVRTSSVGQGLFKMVKDGDGEYHAVILGLSYVTDSSDPKSCGISSLIQESWLDDSFAEGRKQFTAKPTFVWRRGPALPEGGAPVKPFLTMEEQFAQDKIIEEAFMKTWGGHETPNGRIGTATMTRSGLLFKAGHASETYGFLGSTLNAQYRIIDNTAFFGIEVGTFKRQPIP